MNTYTNAREYRAEVTEALWLQTLCLLTQDGGWGGETELIGPNEGLRAWVPLTPQRLLEGLASIPLSYCKHPVLPS